MKKLIFINLFLITSLSFAQTKIASTEDGKKVLLKDNKTWEYLNPETKPTNACVVEDGFIEPKWNKSGSWKKMGTRVEDLKKHISIDLEVVENKITLLQLSEQMGNAIYILCVDGKKMKYRRTGSVFRKDGEDIFKY